MISKRSQSNWKDYLRISAVAVPLACGAMASGAAPQRLDPASRGEIVLNSARMAYNDGNYAFAAQKFREYLKTPTNRIAAASARYGLAMTLIDGPERNYADAAALLGSAVAVRDFPERPYALYYYGVALRGMAETALAKAPARPADAAAKGEISPEDRLAQAAQQFILASDAFAKASAGAAPATQPAQQLAPATEWAVRARCDLAETQIRLRRYKAAVLAVDPLIKNPLFKTSRYHALTLYYHGYASFGLRDFVAAGRSLAVLAPFDQPGVGTHVRYLLARTHHLSGERPEAAAQYEAIVAGYAKDRAAAETALKNAAALKADERARLQAVIANPPDYIAKATFYWGLLLSEQNRYEDALAKFAACVQQFPKSPVVPEATLQAGICLVQVRKYPAALTTLGPLQDHATLGDQALRWLAKAQVGAADPAQPAAYAQAVTTAINTLRKASQRVQAAVDPDARMRRSVIQLELGDLLRLGGQNKEAVDAYAQVVQAPATPAIAEQALERHAVALQLAGQYALADQACLKFQKAYPQSAMATEIALRYAENALLTATAAAPGSDVAKQAYAESGRRFQKLLQQYPDGPHALLAKQGLAMAQYQAGQFAEAAKILATISENDRTGELASISYLQADCLVRTLPADAEDALATARLIEQLTQCCSMFDAYAIGKASSPISFDAAMKVGYCRQRIAALIVDPTEQRNLLAMARRTYTETAARFPDHPLVPLALLEAAKCTAKLGSPAGAAQMLAKFQAEPLKSSPAAPLALIHLADSLRAAGKPLDAVALLTPVRAQHEAAMLKDPSRAEWVPVLQYSLALSLKEAGRYPAARELFESIASNYPKRPEAVECVWRIAQCKKDDAIRELDAARKAYALANTTAAQTAAASALEQAAAAVRSVAQEMASQAEALAKKLPDSEVPLRMDYDAAWCWRSVAEIETDIARRKFQADALRQMQERFAKDNPGKPAPAFVAPNPAPNAIPPQPAELQARARYKAIVDAQVASPLNADARIELAELHLQHDEYAPAIAVLKEILDSDPLPEVADRVHLQLAACQLARNDAKAALAEFQLVIQNTTSRYAGVAREGAAEALFMQQNWAGVVEQLKPLLQQQGPRRVIPTARDRALLRLGHAYAQLGQWQESRTVLEAMVARYPASPLVHEARFALGWACQNLKQYDPAVAAYSDVALHSGAEVAAKAMYEAGTCRLAQNQPEEAIKCLLAAGYGYGYPQWSGAALCEAARVMVELHRPADAKSLLQRVAREQASGKWAELARKRLAEIK